MEIRAVTVERLGDLAELFETGAATRGCWCMWFVSSSEEVRAGWHDGRNRRDFEALAAHADPPLGLIAYNDGVPVG